MGKKWYLQHFYSTVKGQGDMINTEEYGANH